MKFMKDTAGLSLKEMLIHKVGDQLTEMAVDKRGCFAFSIYEPEIPNEVLYSGISEKSEKFPRE